MDIVAWLPNPETDIKTPIATPEDFFWSLVIMIVVLVVFWYIRRKK